MEEEARLRFDPGARLAVPWSSARLRLRQRSVHRGSVPSVAGLGGVGIDIGGGVTPPDRSGYTTMDAFSDGRAVNAHHWDVAFASPGDFKPYAFVNDLPCLVDFVEMISGGLVPESLYIDSSSGDGFLWPRVAASSGGGCGKVVHLVIHDPGNVGYFMYLRRTVGAGAGTDSNWTNVYRFGLGGYLSPTIEASRNSDRVAIAWSGGRGDGTEFGASVDRYNGLISGQTDNDLFYMTSENCGISWSPIRNVTQYADDTEGGFRADSRITAVFDHQDSLNIAWTAAQWFGYSGPFPYAGRIFHWHEGRPVGWTTPGGIRSAVAGEWTPTNCNPGVFNINVTQPQLSSCDTLLYLSYGEYANPLRGHGDDCHVRAASSPAGAANGDLMLTVSSNKGFNWDPPRDLTATYTPDCDTIPGGDNPDCDSDAWHSATRYGINTVGDIFGMADVSANLGGYTGDDFIFVFYVNDRIPGGAIRPEGAWILSKLRTFKFGCVDIVEAAVLSSSLNLSALGDVTGTIDDPAFTLPGFSLDTTWVLENTGNKSLDYVITVIDSIGPTGHVTLSKLSGTIDAGISNKDTITITLNSTLSNTVQNASARIEVVSGANAFVNSPVNLIISYCICDLQEVVWDTTPNSAVLARGASASSGLIFSNHGNLGAQNNVAQGQTAPGGLNFDFTHDLSCECNSYAGGDSTSGRPRGADSYLFDASPIIRYNGSHLVTQMFEFNFVDTTRFRPQVDPTTSEPSEFDPLYNQGSSGIFTTQDSTIGLSVDYYTPVDPLPGCWQMAYVRVCYYNNSASTINDVTLAYALDWDVPSDSISPGYVDNTSEFDASSSRFAIWQQAIDGTPTTEELDSVWNCMPNSWRYAATSFIIADTGEYPPFITGGNDGRQSMGITVPKALYTRENARYVTTEWDLVALDTALDSIFGFSKYTTTEPESTDVDLHTMVNGGEYDLAVGDTAYLWLLLVSCIAPTEDSFLVCLDSARARPIPNTTPPPAGTCCDSINGGLAGDADDGGDVNIGDAIFIVKYAFVEGAPAPPCCGQADADGGGDVNIGDAIYIVKFAFEIGAPPPVCNPVAPECL